MLTSLSCSLNFSYHINLRPWWKEKCRNIYSYRMMVIYTTCTSIPCMANLPPAGLFSWQKCRQYIYWIHRTKHHEKQEHNKYSMDLDRSVSTKQCSRALYKTTNVQVNSIDLKVLLHDPIMGFCPDQKIFVQWIEIYNNPTYTCLLQPFSEIHCYKNIYLPSI